MKIIALYAFIFLTGLTLDAGAQIRAPAEAEYVASEYMTAFFRGDIRTAAALTHPATLKALKEAFLVQTASPASSAKSGTQNDLRDLSPEAFYISMVGADHKRNMAIFEAMKGAQITVVSSEMSHDGNAVVRLQIVTPTSTSTSTQMAGLNLSLSGSLWKVVGNAR